MLLVRVLCICGECGQGVLQHLELRAELCLKVGLHRLHGVADRMVDGRGLLVDLLFDLGDVRLLLLDCKAKRRHLSLELVVTLAGMLEPFLKTLLLRGELRD